MQKLQTQGLHHVTLVGADRRTSIDFWEGVLGMPFVFEQPNLDNAGESHIYFDPGDGRLITVFTREDRKPIQRRTPTDTGCVHHIAFNVSRAVFVQAVERLGARGIPNTGVRDRMIFDAIYFEDPLGLLIELSCWKFDAPEGFTRSDVLFAAHNLRVERGDRAINEVHIADAIENLVRASTKSLSENRAAKDPYRRPAPARSLKYNREEPMSAIKLHIIKPSVNNMTARVFVRAAKLDFTEDDVYGKTRSDEFSARNPSHLTPMMEAPGLPKNVMWESCAIMQYLCNKHHLDRFYPTEPEKRAMVDSAMFYVVGTLYPYVARATYPTLGFPQYAGEVGASDADAAAKEKAQKAAEAAVGETLEVIRKFYLDDKTFIGGDHPSIADIRFACSLEFLNAIDYAFPEWTKRYLSAVETTLGDAYAESAGDVEGYISYVKSQRK